MKRILKYSPIVLLFVLILIVFKNWFLTGLISAGDLWPYYKSMYGVRQLSLYAWDYMQGIGLGGFSGALLWVYLTFGIPLTIFGKIFGLSWNIIERIYFMYPLLVLNVFSACFLFRKIFGKSNFAVLSSAIFTLNSYVLMLVGGGQFGVALAYSLVPIVLLFFVNSINSSSLSLNHLKWSVLSGIILSLQIIFDLRIAYVTLIAVFIYWIFRIFSNKGLKPLLTSFIFSLLIPGLISILLNLFWILPTIFNRQNPLSQLGEAYTSLGMVKFFSFANFENAVGLMHPNWPENLFGKVSFMKPEFLVLPILAFSALLFIRKTKDLRQKTYVLFFSFLALLGVFLAKGANDPFGSIYLWLFQHVPGFMMFRDPTKWYTLVAVAYSILIPFSVWKIYEWLKALKKYQKPRLPALFLLIVCIFFLFLIWPAIFGQLNGAFKTTQIPDDYVRFGNYLSSQNNFSRTLWVPTTQRFSFYNNNHPTVSAEYLFNLYDYSTLVKRINASEKFLQQAGIKYVVIPFDSQGEIFLSDRRYDQNLYLKTINNVRKITWLKQVNGFGRIMVLEVPDVKDHFWSNSKNLKMEYQYISPVEYRVDIANAQKGDVVVFAENYDKNWEIQNTKIENIKFDNKFNSFKLPKGGNYQLVVYYGLQKYVDIGVVVSILSLIGICVFFAILYFKKK